MQYIESLDLPASLKNKITNYLRMNSLICNEAIENICSSALYVSNKQKLYAFMDFLLSTSESGGNLISLKLLFDNINGDIEQFLLNRSKNKTNV